MIGIGWWAPAGLAQIDPEKRSLIQLGYNQPLEETGPLAGYAYYYWNEPGLWRTNYTLRLVAAPVFLDSELGIGHAFGEHTDLGIGLAGGGYAYGHSEVRSGDYLRAESFDGHGLEGSLSLYHRFNPDSQMPLNGILRVGLQGSFYDRDSHTSPAFILPEDQSTFHLRTGLRWGGKEPTILPDLAGELSAWYEGQFRTEPGYYGLLRDRYLESDSHLFWARGLLAYTLPQCQHNFSLSLTLGTSASADRLSAYRLGGMMPMASEFPLNLPGYYFQELSTSRFGLVEGQYLLPLDHGKHWYLMANASSALVDYLPGFEQPGHWNSGVGGGICYRSPSRIWKVMLGYGYGINAIRGQDQGASELGFLAQYDLEAHHRSRQEAEKPTLDPLKLRGFNRLFHR